MTYIDGMVLAVPTVNKQQYIDIAKKCVPVFKDHGAIQMMENWGDDVPDGEVTSFPLAVKCKPDETVVFSIIVWPSKEIRDAGMQKCMEDPRFQGLEMPFDGKRMIMGGFETILDVS